MQCGWNVGWLILNRVSHVPSAQAITASLVSAVAWIIQYPVDQPVWIMQYSL
jgi:hypothetical protein